jgi:two-component system nitrate/nitrite response regulator NarL
VAKQFTISEETVKRHLSNIFDKTGVSTRLELALFAIAHKLVMLDS